MNEQVLIIEDEENTVELLQYNLVKNGYSVVIARNGKEAIDTAKSLPPDIMLLDVMMPEMDGWEVCRIMRQNRQCISIPIIMLSALGDEDARLKGLNLGADDYISKPFSVKELLLKVHKHLERKHEENRLRGREQEQSASLQYLVHELRNAMTAIGGFSSLALQKQGDLPYFKIIKSSALHAQSLLNDAALLGKIERGEALPLSPIDIEPVIAEIKEMFLGAARGKNVEISIANSAFGGVQANGTAFRQVLINLISNAVKYNRPGGKVWISLDEFEDFTEISITDEGCGIAESDIPKIFDKFYRAAGSEKVKGAGLGLHIVKLLSIAMGGTIKVVSNLGEGSTFILSLPRVCSNCVIAIDGGSISSLGAMSER